MTRSSVSACRRRSFNRVEQPLAHWLGVSILSGFQSMLFKTLSAAVYGIDANSIEVTAFARRLSRARSSRGGAEGSAVVQHAI